jgi:hypothetical protein
MPARDPLSATGRIMFENDSKSIGSGAEWRPYWLYRALRGDTPAGAGRPP